jgi:hypothetical protein
MKGGSVLLSLIMLGYEYRNPAPMVDNIMVFGV